MTKKAILTIVLLLCAHRVDSSVNKDLSHFFTKLGGGSNLTRAGAYQDQTAGFYTGGNLFGRNQVHHSQLASLQLPNYRAGCGGIDMFMGAFSHISSERLIEALKAIGSNMGSFALLLAIETMAPQIKNNIAWLLELAETLNQSNINSCEIAATTLGSVWPRSDQSQLHLCKMIGTDGKYGSFSDYAAARQGCGAAGKRDSVINAAQNDPRFKSMLGSEFNLAWKAIQENGFLRSDKKLAEFFLSISGTLISRKEKDESYSFHTKVSLADNDSLLSTLLHGGEVSVYTCKDKGENSKCLDVGQETLKIDPSQSLVAKVKDILISIQNKIYEDKPLDKQEIDFLGSTRLPFYKIINVASAYRRDQSPVQVIDYAELGAVDILFQYLSEILDVIHESDDHIRMSQVDDAQLNRFQKSLMEARARVIQRRRGSFQQMQQVIDIVRKTELLEKSLMSKVGYLSAGGS